MYLTDHAALLKLCSPINNIYDAVAKVESQKKVFNLVKNWTQLKQAVELKTITDSSFRDVIVAIMDITKTNSGTSSIVELKNRLKPFVDLDFNSAYYTSKVNTLYDAQVKDLQVPLAIYGPLLDSVVKAHSDAASWRYENSILQKIVTEWSNDKATCLSSTVVTTSTAIQPKEVA
jgi:hypothetical protein